MDEQSNRNRHRETVAYIIHSSARVKIEAHGMPSSIGYLNSMFRQVACEQRTVKRRDGERAMAHVTNGRKRSSKGARKGPKGAPWRQNCVESAMVEIICRKRGQ